MLQVAQANEGEGSSEDNPIILKDIRARDFNMLVRDFNMLVRVPHTPYFEPRLLAGLD